MSQLPIHLRVNDCVNPVGVGERPYFGWHLHDPRPNQRQTHYQIHVASSLATLTVGDVWNSGQIASGKQNHVVYAGRPLQPNTRYFWTVQTWDSSEQPGPVAEYGMFITGLFRHEDWIGANWIKRGNNEPDDTTYYRHRFALPAGEIEQAVVYVTAVHKYELFLNGRFVNRGPAYHYPQYQYFNAYDVTEELLPGQDNLLALLTHWFGGWTRTTRQCAGSSAQAGSEI